MEAIIRHLRSGQHFRARLDESGNAYMMSDILPTVDARDDDTGVIDWARFADAEMVPGDDPADAWGAERFVVVHRFD